MDKIRVKQIVFKNKTRENLANNLLYFRYSKDWSQEKLAEVSNSSATYVSAVEKGKRKVSIDFIDSVAKAFGIPSSELLVEREKVKPRIRVDSKE